MGERTHISWTGATWNPWHGCRKISPGCKVCYMFRDKERYGQDPTRVVRSARATFEAPLKWQREAERGERVGHARLVFTCSWSDFYIEEADAWRDEAWAIVRACPDLIFQVLTKRADRIAAHTPWVACKTDPWANVWLGVSVEDQARADERIPPLLAIPAAVRFLSVEPLLGPIRLTSKGYIAATGDHPEMYGYMAGPDDGASVLHRTREEALAESGISWAIVGGESGNRTGRYQARPCDVGWVRSIVAQCAAAGVPCWVKQLGSLPILTGTCDDISLAMDGRLPVVPRPELGGFEIDFGAPHGDDPEEWPEDLRVQQMPERFAGVPS